MSKFVLDNSCPQLFSVDALYESTHSDTHLRFERVGAGVNGNEHLFEFLRVKPLFLRSNVAT